MNRERWAFLLLATIVLGYVITRAALVPWVHDECASLFWFVERGEFMPFSAHWDANNHILSSAIGTYSYRLFGLALFGSRMGSVFAFLVFAWASYRIGSSVKGGMVRWCLWAALLLCPFMLEFFSLFRGYGLEIAFWLLAIDGLVRFADRFRTRHLMQALIALLLANAAVLALVPLWMMIVVVLGLSLVWKWRTTSAVERFASIGIWLLLGLAPALFGLRLALELRAQGLLYHGSTEGFMAVTAMPLLGYVFGAERPVLPVATCALLIVLATIIIIRDRAWRSPGFVVAALFWGDAVLRIGMAHLLGVNYPKIAPRCTCSPSPSCSSPWPPIALHKTGPRCAIWHSSFSCYRSAC